MRRVRDTPGLADVLQARVRARDGRRRGSRGVLESNLMRATSNTSSVWKRQRLAARKRRRISHLARQEQLQRARRAERIVKRQGFDYFHVGFLTQIECAGRV